MFRMIGFDLDGTLADTLPLCIQAFGLALSPYAGHTLSEEEITATFGLDEVGISKILAGDQWEAGVADYCREYRRLHPQLVPDLFPGIRDLLLTLKDRGIPLVLVTGKGTPTCTISLEEWGISHLFHEVLCGSDVAPNKVDHLRYLLDKYQLAPEEFCYIGDTPTDVDACHQAGVTCLSAAWQDGVTETLEQRNPGKVFARVADCGAYLLCNT
ncbi:HAD family hydrolase [Pseudoflavonifractor sp. An85]|uniref:HAD family hydrolase n=1 Tax=Pseudoflavonifractor sp. An85 TaxID=1965661 RepID=UPI000B367E7A|nr:HAD family hydrolase [Pseudoflavonifractor sp. An85]OUN19386.1 hypothetical protein B5G37_13670 [Pseudoflavonifractor sp. An85]